MVMNGESIICNGALGEQPEIGLILLNDRSVYFSISDCVHWVKRYKTRVLPAQALQDLLSTISI